jgi:REP-associated tyrosine transposase
VTADSNLLYNVHMTKREQLKSNNNVVYSCKYHVIWCPKYRRPVLVDAVEKRLKYLIQQQTVKFKADLIELEVMPDHVHLLVEVDPQFGIHRLIRNIKGYTSRILRSEFTTLRTRIPTLWTNSYCVLSVGGAPLSVIKQYIENQKGV